MPPPSPKGQLDRRKILGLFFLPGNVKSLAKPVILRRINPKSTYFCSRDCCCGFILNILKNEKDLLDFCDDGSSSFHKLYCSV
jgi:hypothetical protein